MTQQPEHSTSDQLRDLAAATRECTCGCGQRTNLSDRNCKAKGLVKGRPNRFIQGHTKTIPFDERYWSKVNKTRTCWLWTGVTGKDGYGRFSVKTAKGWRNQLAHRMSFQILIGQIPDGLQLDHLCRVRNCVNPNHLEPVTNQENCLRGVGPQVTIERQRSKTRCPQGHEYTKDNTYIDPKGARNCRECKRFRDRSRNRKHYAN